MEEKETISKNFSLYMEKLDKLGVNTDKLREKYGMSIANGSFTQTNEHGNAYNGSLLEIILRVLTPYAVKLNELLPEERRVDKNSLVKVCLLHHIGKSINLIPNDNQWEVEKRGFVYKYNQNIPSMKTGLISLSMCNECGIELTMEEIEALTINDRVSTDEQAKWFSGTMATIVKVANEFTYLQINGKK